MDQAQEKSVLDLVVAVCGTRDVLDERDVDLFEAGLMDSMGFIELLVGLEEDLGLHVSPTSVDRSEVSSVNQILAFVSRLAG